MSKVNKSSKSDDSSKKSASKSTNSKSSTKDTPKLEVIKVIAPKPVEPEPTEEIKSESKLEAVSADKGKVKTKAAVAKSGKPKVGVADVAPESIATPRSVTPKETVKTDVSLETPDQDLDQVTKVCLQPIPEATEPFQYRAIGVVLGQYVPADDNFAKGHILTADGSEVDAVLLGKIISIVKKRLQSDRPYLWVVYPRTNDKSGKLHVQISGVWAPVELGKAETDLDPNVSDGYFSVRGEVSSQSTEDNSVIVKIRRIEQKSGKNKDKATKEYTKFKVRLTGLLPTDAVGQFWSINVQRQGDALTIVDGEFIGVVPYKGKRRPPAKGRFGNKFGGGAKKYSDRPYKPTGDGTSTFAPPRPKSAEDRPPVPKPLIKRKDIEPKSD